MYSTTIKTEFIKIEPMSEVNNETVSGSEFIKIEPVSEVTTESFGSHRKRIKQEPGAGEQGAEKTKEGLNTGHTVKDELVIASKVMQPPVLPAGPSSRQRRCRVPPVISPIKKRKPTTLSIGDRTIVINAFQYVKDTWPEDQYRSNPEMVKKTSDITGVSIRSIYGILKEFIETNSIEPKGIRGKQLNINQKLADYDKTAIRQKVHSFYIKGELPTLDKILLKINEDRTLPKISKTSLRRVLRHLKFKYIKKIRKSALIDHPEIVLWRTKYLKEIQEYRNENRNIYYLHEAWANAGLSTGAKNPTERGTRLIFVHVGNEDGFLEDCRWVFESSKTGEYHASMDAPLFEKWFAKVLGKLKEHDVIVMDTASHRSRRLEIIPTLTWRKQDIVDWLRSKSVDVSPDDTRAHLLSKVKMIKNEFQGYVTDVMAKQKGVTVLRLPPYHCELNPIQLVWEDAKRHAARHNTTFKLSDVRNLLTEGLGLVTPDKWRHCVERVKKEETNMRALDYQIDKTVDSFLANVTGSFEEDSSGSDSSDTDVELSSSELSF